MITLPARLFHKPLALVVFLENVGHIAGVHLPKWVMAVIDFATEEYAKLLLRLLGAYRRYDRVIILEDARATGEDLAQTLTTTSQTHRVDLLLLVHGLPGKLVGFRGRNYVGAETFGPLQTACALDPKALDLRMVYGLNCHGITLAPVWTALGAQAVNGAAGINWLPEPSLSVFLYHWLRGRPYSEAVERSNLVANKFWRRIWRPNSAGEEHPFLCSSRQIIVGASDLTVDSR